jgi:ABC-type transport system involved in multi-copper enzyme maturation permease subunit
MTNSTNSPPAAVARWHGLREDPSDVHRGTPWAARSAGMLAALVVSAACWMIGWQGLATAVLGMTALAVGLVLGLMAVRAVLSGSHGVIGVGRAVVEEAAGTRLSVMLVMLVVVGLPVLPLVLDPSERLAYRMQFFLDWSLSGAAFLLAMISIVLACGSVCGDIDTHRIHMTLVKPIRRWQYLLGKWLGIVLLNLLLVALVGIAVYSFVQSLRRAEAVDPADRIAVEEQVLTARRAGRPVHPRGDGFEQSVAAATEQMRKDDPAMFAKDPVGARKRIRAQQILEWHTVNADVVSSYLFTGLDRKRMQANVVQLRLNPFADNSGISRADVRFALWLNERPFPMRDGRHEEFTLASATPHTINLPSSVIGDDGVLRLTIANRNLIPPGEQQPTSISFSPGEGLEILYRSGSFEANFLRGLLVMWAKLSMLTAGALASSSWLGFPVAVLTSMMIYIAAAASSFLADAIDIYTGLDNASPTLVSMVRLRSGLLLERINKLEWWEAAKTIASYFADGFLWLIPSFGDYDAIRQVATGRLVSLTELCSCLVELGLVYPLVLLAIGWFLLERRDLVNLSGSSGG